MCCRSSIDKRSGEHRGNTSSNACEDDVGREGVKLELQEDEEEEEEAEEEEEMEGEEERNGTGA